MQTPKLILGSERPTSPLERYVFDEPLATPQEVSRAPPEDLDELAAAELESWRDDEASWAPAPAPDGDAVRAAAPKSPVYSVERHYHVDLPWTGRGSAAALPRGYSADGSRRRRGRV